MLVTVTGLMAPVCHHCLQLQITLQAQVEHLGSRQPVEGSTARISPTGWPPPVTGLVASCLSEETLTPSGPPPEVSSSSSLASSGASARWPPSSILTAPARPSARAKAQTPSAPPFMSRPGTAAIHTEADRRERDIQVG